MLERIQVKGFKSIKEMDLTLRPLNVLIGANGSGKSNFLSLFTMLRWLAEGRLQNFVLRSGGVDTLLQYGRKETSELYTRLDIRLDNSEYDCISYRFGLAPTGNERFYFSSESVQTCLPSNTLGPNFSFGGLAYESRLKFAEETNIPAADILAKPLIQYLETLSVYQFHDTGFNSRIKGTPNIHDNEYLHADGANLAAFLYRLQQNYPAEYDRIVKTVRLVAPFFDSFVLNPVSENPDTIRLKWLERYSEDPFDISQLSDGTLRFICLTTLLLQPHPPALIIIDEPELGLHPYAVSVLVSLLQEAAVDTQVIVATQSIQMVNYFEPEDLVVVDRRQGVSSLRRVNEAEVQEWLEDYSLGEVWEKNIIGGRPQR